MPRTMELPIPLETVMNLTSTRLSAKLQEALSLHQQGQLDSARTLYAQILDVQPRHAVALHLSGVIEAQTGNPGKAVELIGAALEIDSNDAGAYCNRGLAFQQLGELDAALRCFDKAIAINANFAEAHSNRGNVLRELNRWEAALASCNRAIELKPDLAQAYLNRGIIQRELKQLDAALASYDRAIAINAGFAEAHSNRGDVLKELKQLGAALASCNRAIALKPDFAEAYSNRGNVLKELNQWNEALASCNRAIALKADLAQAHCNRGNVLFALRQCEAALASYDQAIAIKADYAEAYTNRGNVLAELGQFDAALASYDRAIVLKPGDPDAHSNRGTLFHRVNQIDAALASYDQAIEVDAGFADGRVNRSMASLLIGDYASGWLDLEWREKRRFAQPQWLGEQSIEGKTVLLHSEQGLGDTLQFCRYAHLVAGLGAKVILQVQEPLASLLASLEGIEKLLATADVPPAFDYHCPLMSLPLAFKTTLSTIPARIPYLRASAEKTLEWKVRLGEKRKIRVGLVWSGCFRPNQPELWAVNRRRNVPLAKLAVLKHPDIEFYTLQKGQPAELELADALSKNWDGPHLIDYTSELRDFSDTAGLVENLDLVISVDTSTAHLAGALGKPVWILNRFDTCWRWLLRRDDSPWYPTVRLYRQETAGDWDGVVRRVKQDLVQLV